LFHKITRTTPDLTMEATLDVLNVGGGEVASAFGEALTPMMDLGAFNMNTGTAFTGELRPWGSADPVPAHFAGDREAEKRRRAGVAMIEMEALHQMSLEVCKAWRPRYHATKELFDKYSLKHVVEKTVPSDASINDFRSNVEKRLNLVERFIEVESVAGRPDGHRVEAVCDGWPGGNYRGRFRTDDEAKGKGDERITWEPQNLNEDHDPEDPQSSLAGWWIEPDPSGVGYVLAENAYGTPMFPIERLTEAREKFGKARRVTEEALALLKAHQVFPRMNQCNDQSEIDCMGYVRCRQRLLDTLNDQRMIGVHPSGGPRQLLTQRVKLNAEGRALLNDVRHMMTTSLTTRYAETRDGGALIFQMLTAADHWQEVFEEFDASQAATFMRVYLGQCPRDEKGDKIVDGVFVSALRMRFPRLHLFTVPDTRYPAEQFPHRLLPNGEGVIYGNGQIHINVGMVTSRLRTRLRHEGRMKQLHTTRLSVPHYELTPLTEAQKRDPDHDHGYRRHEGVLYRMVADQTDPVAPRRRTNDNGWSEVRCELDDDQQLSNTNPLRYFHRPPEISVTLVHADSRVPVVPDHPYGGLEPQQHLRSMAHAGGRMLLCPYAESTGPKLSGHGHHKNRPWVVPDIDPRTPDKNFQRPTAMRALHARFVPKCLSQRHQGGKFRIVVTCTGTAREMGNRTLVLKTESMPLTFYCDNRGGEKRRKSPASSPSEAAAASSSKRPCP
tara:strand:+ start:536 stop:2707 length:2172 start_codon:yes stop_codon:yes gene_type:complete